MKYPPYTWILLCLRLLLLSVGSGSERIMSSAHTLSTHILDTSIGRAVPNVPVSLYRLQIDKLWQKLNESVTNTDGRINQLIDAENFTSGIYKLHFETEAYFKTRNLTTFYPYIEIVVECVAGESYHVPLLLNAFGYSTYRGT